MAESGGELESKTISRFRGGPCEKGANSWENETERKKTDFGEQVMNFEYLAFNHGIMMGPGATQDGKVSAQQFFSAEMGH